MHQEALISLFQARSQPLEPEPTGQAPRLPRLDGIRGVVFDIYGTLFASGVGDISLVQGQNRDEAIARAFEESGCPLLTARDELNLTHRLFQEIEAQQEIASEKGADFPEVDIRDVWQKMSADLQKEGHLAGVLTNEQAEDLAVRYELAVNPVWPMPGLLEMLGKLHGNGLALGIISNAQFFTPLMFPALTGKNLEELGISGESCLYSYDLLEAKPSTRLYQQAAEAFNSAHGIQAAELLYVGNDMRNDVWPAQATGFQTALFAGDARSLRWRKEDTQLAGVTPDAVVTELEQIPKMLGLE